MPGFAETAAAQECAGEMACDPNVGYQGLDHPSGLVSANYARNVKNAEYQQQMRAQQFHAALHTLKSANALRADKQFMAELREYVRGQRDDLGALLDDLG